MDEPYVTIEELAKHFSMSVHTLRKWLQKGELPALKLGRVYRFRISEVEAYLKNKSQDLNDELGAPEQLSLDFDIDDPNEDI